MMFTVNPQVDLATLLNDNANDRRWVGPDPWLKAIGER